ncbi:hypothetical protein SB00094_04177 [Klebsiella variicola subsp. tropica]|uniref:AAA family ATPase n=1 Tax=Klebsiella variicola TaxID=244366 RepID=UPI0007D0C74C|nr:AAA family ATPase [Klebsiella variicola]UDC27248.1 AAA family ATPase [Klebsiella variicola subsp. tropica]SBM93950.1 hypothetical protein KVMX100_120215 [Klebsiella variicola]VGP73762.1 hypothetical protein SB00094_04177 [Klebsiella variicola subsp. tropica]
MELVFVYVEEHKILKNIGASFSSNYKTTYVDNVLKIVGAEDKTFDYYRGCNIKAIVGQNGTGKSSILDFIETSCSKYTESSGFIVWYDYDERFFLVHDLNDTLKEVRIECCSDYRVVKNNKRYLINTETKIFKINNISSVGLYGLNKKTSNVVDYSLGTQSKYRGKKRTVNLGRMLNFFNNSEWLKSKQAGYKYVFEFKQPSATIRKWVFSLLDEINKDLSEKELKSKNRAYEMELFELEPIFYDKDSISVEDIFQGLLKRNVFSFVRAMPSMRIASSKTADSICIELINSGVLLERINNKKIIDMVKLVHERCSKDTRAGIYDLFDYNEILDLHFSRFLDSLMNVSHAIADAIALQSKGYADKIESNNYECIINLLDSFTTLHTSIVNNFNYGWEGFSTGELAKLNVFSSLYNIYSEFEGRNALIIVDEVDLFLHPEWQRTFLNELVSFIEGTNFNAKLQIILTTHSPIIIGDFLPKDIVSLRLNEDNIPVIVDSYGFGTGITESYILGMHIKSTYGELSRLKLSELINNKIKGVLSDNDKIFIEQISNAELKESMLK